MEFKITSKYQPTGDQPQAIRQLTEGVEQGDPAQVLLGVTGSGKTLHRSQCHCQRGKADPHPESQQDSAAQLYQEMKRLLP